MLAVKEEADKKAAARAAEEQKAAERRAAEEKRAAEEALRKAREDVALKVKTHGVAALTTQDIVVILEQEQVSCVGNVGQLVVADARVRRRQRRKHSIVLMYTRMVWWWRVCCCCCTPDIRDEYSRRYSSEDVCAVSWGGVHGREVEYRMYMQLVQDALEADDQDLTPSSTPTLILGHTRGNQSSANPRRLGGTRRW